MFLDLQSLPGNFKIMLKLNLALFLSFSFRANRQVYWITYSHYNEEWQGNCGSTSGIWWLCQYPFFLYMSMYMSHDCPYVSCTHVLNNFIIWLALWTGKMNQITLCDWPPEWTRWSYSYSLGVTRHVPWEKPEPFRLVKLLFETGLYQLVV